jgi:hypothetical protein
MDRKRFPKKGAGSQRNQQSHSHEPCRAPRQRFPGMCTENGLDEERELDFTARRTLIGERAGSIGNPVPRLLETLDRLRP